jgi:hypothetical protein
VFVNNVLQCTRTGAASVTTCQCEPAADAAPMMEAATKSAVPGRSIRKKTGKKRQPDGTGTRGKKRTTSKNTARKKATKTKTTKKKTTRKR